MNRLLAVVQALTVCLMLFLTALAAGLAFRLFVWAAGF
jgi:hypothetical protein